MSELSDEARALLAREAPLDDEVVERGEEVPEEEAQAERGVGARSAHLLFKRFVDRLALAKQLLLIDR